MLFSEAKNISRRKFMTRKITFGLRVHKLILMARSPVFQAMLGSDMVEKSQGMIKIEVS